MVEAVPVEPHLGGSPLEQAGEARHVQRVEQPGQVTPLLVEFQRGSAGRKAFLQPRYGIAQAIVGFIMDEAFLGLAENGFWIRRAQGPRRFRRHRFLQGPKQKHEDFSSSN